MSKVNPYLRGFSLVELTVVLFIVALLMGGMMTTISVQVEQQRIKDTQRILEEAKEALIGFAAVNGRLPCPASPSTTGVENPSNGGSCVNPWNGFLPAVTLGLPHTDAQGYALDAWGNQIRYAIPSINSYAYTTSGSLSTAWSNASCSCSSTCNSSCSSGSCSTCGCNKSPDLRVCTTATGLTGSGGAAYCATGATLTCTAAAVIFSRGKNGGVAPTSNDETANDHIDGTTDRIFVSHVPAAASSGNEFDDIVTWISPNILFNRMIAAGTLP